ncbi:MAG TPA: aldehyde dehydrogenase [Deltaproteobacteria bacterium]|nr:aldehyde dehydrogenase [Deltaproteobacteria bacterium]HCP46287.1 aldehyde dehydrogenase [Deltaproteobacteria bacterium]
MPELLRTISPVDGSTYVERALARDQDIDGLLTRAVEASESWKRTPLHERVALLRAVSETVESWQDELAAEITWQMGRPITQSSGEIAGFVDRATTMLDLAEEALADLRPGSKTGFERFVRREPLGVILALAPWNYPYLCAVNAIVPALAAGNTVVLKHSDQTPLCAERIAEATQEAGLPDGVFQVLHCSHAQVADMVGDHRVNFVSFTGSVDGGRAVTAAAAQRFVGLGLELGGKDPAYVRRDADLDRAIEGLVDGAFFNSGQSCCAIERIYVERPLYAQFVEAFAEQTRQYKLGNPLHEDTTLGPMVRASNAGAVREQIAAAVAAGAHALIDEACFPASTADSAYLAPQVLIDVDHTMAVMREESFGPVVGIMEVDGDDDAIHHMNDSRYGLTASIWTRDTAAALSIGDRIETGTVFMNRCDFLDPELAWAGVKDSGRGCSLSLMGYEQLTRPKSFHFRLD